MPSLLFGVSANDPVVFGAVAGVLAAVAFGACALPAARPVRVQLGCPQRAPARCYQWQLIDRSSDAGVTETYDMRVIFPGTETPCVDGGRKSPEPLIM
jgi:hypothetical protein